MGKHPTNVTVNKNINYFNHAFKSSEFLAKIVYSIINIIMYRYQYIKEDLYHFSVDVPLRIVSIYLSIYLSTYYF